MSRVGATRAVTTHRSPSREFHRRAAAAGRRRVARDATPRTRIRASRDDEWDDPWLNRMMDAAMEAERREGAKRDAQGTPSAAATPRDGDDDEANTDARDDDDEDEDDEAWERYFGDEIAHGDLSESMEAEILGVAARGSGLADADADARVPAGPPAVALVGFRAEEWPRVRVLMDELGGYDVPVIPARAEHAWMSLDEVCRTEEPDWESPRRDADARGGEYGSHRALVFSGLDLGEIAVVVSAIEAQGLPRLPVVIASEENLREPLGASLAEAFKRHRIEMRRKRHATATNDAESPREVVVGEIVVESTAEH